jgi:transcriptional regulator of acetoin/glycerol metabolism
LADLELARIHEVVTRCAGDTRKAAGILGISRATLYRRLGSQKQQPLPIPGSSQSI